MSRYLKLVSLMCGMSAVSAAPRPAYTEDFASVQGMKFDYIIVGGGLSGLVVANRLTESREVNVLVIENGAIDDRPPTKIPYFANINVDNYYDINSAPEPYMHNKTYGVHVGNVLGGGSVVNGMAFDRGANADYDAWEELGNPGWGFKDMEKYFKKSTHFDGPSEEARKRFNITFDARAYGNGPVKVSIPSYQYDDYRNIMGSFRESRIPYSNEGFAKPLGTFWAPNTIDNSTKERCHARNAYYDPIQRRSNLKLLINTHVDEILFKRGKRLTAHGLKITSNNKPLSTSVYATKDIILAAGGIFTPHLLMVSGIGPKEVLNKAGIAVKQDLAAVGSNFQDHQALYMIYKLSNQSIPNPDMLVGTNIDIAFNISSATQYFQDRTGPWTFGRGNAAAFLPFKQFSTKYRSITDLISKQDAKAYLPKSYAEDNAILKGFLAQRKILIKHYLADNAAVGEFPIQPWGRATTALQKPLSRGTLVLNTTHPSAHPIIVRNAFQNPVDKLVLGELVRWNRQHWTTHPLLKRYSPVETNPGAQYQTDDEIFEASIESGALNPTYAHSCGTCALMPEKLGGCVDVNLRIYGVDRLRVVDASILPLIPAAHLQATMYAVAEKASDIIKMN